MTGADKAFAAEWLRLAQGIEAADEGMAERVYALVVSTHAAVDRAIGKLPAARGENALFDVRAARFDAGIKEQGG